LDNTMPRKAIFTDRLMRPIAHFSHASRVGNVVHVGAVAGVFPGLRLAGDSPGRIDVVAQTAKMFENLETELELIGARLPDVVRIKTYMAFPRDVGKYLELFARHFASILPAHTVVGSWDFPLPQAAIELDAIAIIGGANKSLRSDGLASFPGCAVAGVQADDFHYATALPVDTNGRVAAPSCREQMIAALRNLCAMLKAAALASSDVVNIHLTLADMRDLDAAKDELRAFFGERMPTFTAVGAPLERTAILVTIESVAFKGGGDSFGSKAVPLVKGNAAPAIVAGDMLFISGQSGHSDSGVDIDAELQTRAAWQRVHGLIEAAGFAPDSLIRTNNVLMDWRDYSRFNAGYGANAHEPYIPRATVLGQLSDARARMQIEGIAHRDGSNATILQVPPASA
jgi:enamine deaminase RidA (YjgF/YER057c/UK114 family)